MVDDEWDGTARGLCLKCGSQNIHHYYVGMPSYGLVDAAPEWVTWSCVAGPQDRGCEDCGFLWCSPGELEGFRNVWEVLAYYGVQSLDELGERISEEVDPDVSFDLRSEVNGVPVPEALVPIVGQRSTELQFPFPNEILLRTIDELVEELQEKPSC